MRNVKKDRIASISEERESIYDNKPSYHEIVCESGIICYYEGTDAKRFKIGDEVQGIINESSPSYRTYYPKTFENISYIKRRSVESIKEILERTEIIQ